MSQNTPDHWSPDQDRVFSRLYRFMSEHQPLFVKPGATAMPDDEWSTLSWNASWMAAEAMDPDSNVVVVDADTDEELAREHDGAMQ